MSLRQTCTICCEVCINSSCIATCRNAWCLHNTILNLPSRQRWWTFNEPSSYRWDIKKTPSHQKRRWPRPRGTSVSRGWRAPVVPRGRVWTLTRGWVMWWGSRWRASDRTRGWKIPTAGISPTKMELNVWGKTFLTNTTWVILLLSFTARICRWLVS